LRRQTRGVGGGRGEKEMIGEKKFQKVGELERPSRDREMDAIRGGKNYE